MATLYEQFISQNTRCFACGSLVYAVEKKMTTHHAYHNRCFRCRICKRNLTGYSLNEEGDDIYCANCYRKKQRGDCNSLEFHRAAAEKAQYVHNRHHLEQQDSLNHPRTSSFRDISRHPSLTLRQLERQVLSHQQSNNNNEIINETNQKSFSMSSPLTINTNFSTPISLSTFRYNSSSPHISPLRTATPITLHKTQNFNDILTNNDKTKSIISPRGNSTNGIEFRLNKSSMDLTHITSPRTDRKIVITPKINENIQQKESKFYFPDYNTTPTTQRRSRSANLRMKTIENK